MWFKIDFNKLAILLLPTFLRRPVLVAFLQTLITPVSSLYDLWSVKRQDNLYRLDHNGQVCHLRKALNDTFDPSLRRIYLDDGSRFKRKYIYTPAEGQSRYLGTAYLQSSVNYGDTGVDFKVVVPAGFDLDANRYQLEALINFYKLASKRHTIETA